MNKKLSKNLSLKILIVSKYIQVQNHLTNILSKIELNKLLLNINNSYSIEECKLFILNNPDTALIIIDAPQTSYELQVIDYIRNTIKNKTVQIILKGTFCENNPCSILAAKHNINVFLNNNLLNDDMIITSVISCLKNFQDLRDINESKSGLEQVMKSSSMILGFQSTKKFASRVLIELSSLVYSKNNPAPNKVSCFMASISNGKLSVLCGFGKYSYGIIKNNIPSKIVNQINEVVRYKKSKYFDDHFIIYLNGENDHIIYFENYSPLSTISTELIEVFSTNIAATLTSMCLNTEIENTEKELIFTLGEISEARSRETSHHVKRVAEYSKVLALMYGLPEKEAEIIRLASPMHDVGKLAIPDSILNKPGKLTAEEFQVMKNHSRIGYEMLKNSNKRLMKSAAIIALEHHEKYNGTGYPYRLSGDEIHIYGRITAIADVFDALDSKRVYKDAWELSDILALFRKERGEHFDPKLVDIFFNNIDKILIIRDKFSDKVSL